MRVCARGCVRARRHVTDCPDRDTCRGCLPREAEFGDLCYGCHTRLELMLVDFPVIVDWLRVHLARSGSSAARQDWQRPGGSDGAPTPIDLNILDLGEQIASSLAGWVDRLVESTSLTGPSLRPVQPWGTPRRFTHDLTAEVEVTASFLRAQLSAVQCQPFVAEMLTELAWLTSQAHALAPWRDSPRRLTGVPCPECAAARLVIFSGEEDTTCLDCHAMIPASRYDLWVKIVAADALRAGVG